MNEIVNNLKISHSFGYKHVGVMLFKEISTDATRNLQNQIKNFVYNKVVFF